MGGKCQAKFFFSFFSLDLQQTGTSLHRLIFSVRKACVKIYHSVIVENVKHLTVSVSASSLPGSDSISPQSAQSRVCFMVGVNHPTR